MFKNQFINNFFLLEPLTIFLILIFNIIIIINFVKLSEILGIYDLPKEDRKIHKKPIPSIGGILILSNLFFFYFLNFFYDTNIFLGLDGDRSLINLFVIGTLICFFGLYDDKFGISPINKFIILVLLIYISLILDPSLILKKLNFNNFSIQIDHFSIFFTILCFVIFLNAFNMFDGINGQSGLYSLFILIFLLSKAQSIFSIYIAISLISFLYLNLNNKTFLGDNGSYLLSYLLSCLVIKTYNNPNFLMTVEEIFLIMIYPGLDLIRLFFLRTIKGKHPFFPDNTHIHHIILQKTKSQLITLIINISSLSLPIIIYFVLDNVYFSIFIAMLIYLFNFVYFNRKTNG